jgi:hypothetical protein
VPSLPADPQLDAVALRASTATMQRMRANTTFTSPDLRQSVHVGIREHAD